jgi:hypothetical protein
MDLVEVRTGRYKYYSHGFDSRGNSFVGGEAG